MKKHWATPPTPKAELPIGSLARRASDSYMARVRNDCTYADQRDETINRLEDEVQAARPLIERINALDLSSMGEGEAMLVLYTLKRMAEKTIGSSGMAGRRTHSSGLMPA